LDTIPGRFIDNANFFALDDFRKVVNNEPFDRLITALSQWFKEAKAKGVIRYISVPHYKTESVFFNN